MENTISKKGLSESLKVLHPKEFRKKVEHEMTVRFCEVFSLMLKLGKIKRYSHNQDELTVGNLVKKMYGNESSGRATLFRHLKKSYSIPYSSVLLFCVILEIPEWQGYILTGEGEKPEQI